MRRARWLWLCFGLGAVVVLAAMTWLTQDVRALAHAGAEAGRRVRTDAAARAALWRIDSALAGMIAAEGVETGATPSTMPPALAALKQVRFRKGIDGCLVFPDGVGAEADGERWLDRLESLPASAPAPAVPTPVPLPVRSQRVAPVQQPAQQADYNERQQLNGNVYVSSERLGPPRVVALGDDALAILRSGDGSVAAGRAVLTEELERALAASVADLLPNARILPCADPTAAEYPLATMPLRLEPGALPTTIADPLMPTLTVAWICVVVAIVAMGALLAGAMALAERRATFVSAVTHELRTPITSLRLYADMLAEGMARDEAKRAEYLGTIRAEAERLGRLVENVLAYARLERTALATAARAVDVAEVVATCRDRLERRAREAGIALDVDLGEAGAARVLVDPTLVEQVLFNLVDNAAKYAAAGKRVELRAERRERSVALSVRDFGPGIAPDVRSRLFRPFSRSAREAAGSAPGVGLGLALSRRLARQLGGELAVVACEQGASFELTLPVA